MAHIEKMTEPEFWKFVDLCQSYPVLIPFWLIITSLVVFFLSKLVFRYLIRFEFDTNELSQENIQRYHTDCTAIELNSGWNVSVPGSDVKSHVTASDWWNKGVRNNWVSISVSFENLINGDQVKHLRLMVLLFPIIPKIMFIVPHRP